MTATAYQLPVHTSGTGKVGKRLYRKQILPIGSINYKGRRVDFSRPMLKAMVDNFNAGAYDQVPFMMADAANAHTMDPERMRGEVRRLELADDGLYALLDLSDDGAKVIESNPRLGVSARIVQGLERADGKRFAVALNHVLGTLDPRVVGMKPWEQVDLASGDETTVVDLTAASFTEGEPAMGHDDKKVTLELSAEQAERLTKLLSDEPAKPATAPAGNGEPGDEISDEELDRILAEMDAEGGEQGEAAQEIAAAVALGEQNSLELAAVQAELAAERWKNQRQQYLQAGVPPALLKVPGVAELASAKDTDAIELSNGGGKTVPVGDVIRGLLDAAKGVVDLSTTPIGSDEAAGSEVDDLVTAWGKQYFEA